MLALQRGSTAVPGWWEIPQVMPHGPKRTVSWSPVQTSFQTAAQMAWPHRLAYTGTHNPKVVIVRDRNSDSYVTVGVLVQWSSGEAAWSAAIEFCWQAHGGRSGSGRT
jgi:hypothetical protein